MPIAAKFCLNGINFVDRVFENATLLSTNEFAVHLWVIDLQDPWTINLVPEHGCLDAINPTIIAQILDPPMPGDLISSLQDASSSHHICINARLTCQKTGGDDRRFSECSPQQTTNSGPGSRVGSCCLRENVRSRAFFSCQKTYMYFCWLQASFI